MAPDDQTVVVLELPCERNDTAWDLSADALKTKAADLLVDQGLIDPQDVVAFDDHSVPFAYPILDLGAAEKAETMKAYLDRFENLHLLGRSADFTYTHVHNLYADAKSLAQRFATVSSQSGALS
jgi:protoporphyrinogen oxidase